MHPGFTEAGVNSRAGWTMLGLILFAQTISPMGYYGLSALAPFILDDWGINRQQFGMLVSAFSAGTFLLAFPAGILTDRIGVRAILLSGLSGVGLFITLAPWVGRFGWVLVIMLGAGFGYGLMNPAASKAVYFWFPPGRRAMALSIKQTSLPLCGALSGLLLPPVSHLLGWRQTWSATGTATLITAFLTAIIYRGPPLDNSYRVSGRALTSASVGLLKNRVMLRLILCGFFLTGIQISWHNYIALFLKDHLGFIFIGPVFGAIVDGTGGYAYGWLLTCLLAALAAITLISIRSQPVMGSGARGSRVGESPPSNPVSSNTVQKA